MARDKDKDPREKYKPPIVRELLEDDDEAPPRKRTGRPQELNRRRIKNIAFNILSGADIEVATKMTGVSRPTYYVWRDKGRKGRSSTNPKEQEELALYVEFLDTCEEALAARKGVLESIVMRATEKDWRAAQWALERMERIEAMVRARREKREAAKESAKAAKEAAENGGVGGFQFYIPTKDGEPLDVVCSVCNEQFDENRKCKCTKMSPRKRLMAGEELPIELLKKLAEVEGVAFDEKDPTGTAERIRKAIGGDS